MSVPGMVMNQSGMEKRCLPAEQMGETPEPETEGAASPGMRLAMKGAAALGAAILAQGCVPPPIIPGDPYPDVPPPKLSPELRRLVERCSFGLNAREAELAEKLGYGEYLEYHLDYEAIDDSDLDRQLANFAVLNYTPRQIQIRLALLNFQPLFDFAHATFLRSAYSTRQLYERMVEFWTNHFNIHIEKDLEAQLKPVDDREVIRKHSMTTFPELLSASAHSAAMLHYLDNTSSVAENPNQNYARELLELHTLGVDNYTQQDVLEVARCLTGWTLVQDPNRNDFGTFYFNNAIHDNGPKTVFGFEIPAGGGQNDGEIVLDILSRDPAIAQITARHLGRKLAVQFWGYDPPEALVQDIAGAYMRTGGDIREMIRAACAQKWISSAPIKLKRPYHLVMSALRARPSDIVEPQAFMFLMQVLGNLPFYWAAPDGYPDSKEYWGQQLMPRWSILALLVLQDTIAPMDLQRFLIEMTPEEFVDEVNVFFFNGSMPQDHYDAVLAFVSDKMQVPVLRKEAVGLALGSAAYQWY